MIEEEYMRGLHAVPLFYNIYFAEQILAMPLQMSRFMSLGRSLVPRQAGRQRAVARSCDRSIMDGWARCISKSCCSHAKVLRKDGYSNDNAILIQVDTRTVACKHVF